MRKQAFEWKWRIHCAGMTQKSFCQKYGINYKTFSKWVRGRSQPRYENIDKVEAALKELGV